MTDTKKRNALGRGLSALLSDNQESASKTDSGGGGSNEIPVEQIETNPYQPRTYFDEVALNELAESIKVHGIIQPITVRQLSRSQFQLISGERRLQAAKLAGLAKVPAYIRTADDQQMLEMALIENIQREDLNPIEVALSYQRLISEINLKQEQLGERVGKNRSTVTNYLRLLKLPPDIQIGLKEKKISMGHARALINIENADLQLDIFNEILSNDLSVRQVEEQVRARTNKGKKEIATDKGGLSPEYLQVQGRLSSHFGTKVSVKADLSGKGELRIPFASQEEFNRLLDIINL